MKNLLGKGGLEWAFLVSDDDGQMQALFTHDTNSINGTPSSSVRWLLTPLRCPITLPKGARE